MSLDFKLLYREFTDAKNAKSNWYAQFMEIYQYVIPNRTAFNVAYDYDNSARFENLQIYDFTPVMAAYQRANDLHGLLMPKDRKWARLAVNKNRLKDPLPWDQEAYLDEANDLAFSELERSNLSSEAANGLLDLIGGMGCLKVESPSDEMPLKFTCIPAYLVYVGRNQAGEIEKAWVKERLYKWQIVQRYPDATKLQAVRDADDLELIDIYTGQVKIDDKANWCTYAFHESDHEHPFYYQEIYYEPLIIFRDRVHPGESEGRGIAMDIIWQIRDLNRLGQMNIRSMANKMDPAIFYDPMSPWNPQSLRNGLSGLMIPGSATGRPPLEAFITPPTPQECGITIEDLRNQIKTAFLVDPLGTIDQPVRSATEMAIRENRAQRTTSTDISRLINDLPKKVFETAIRILVHRGIISFAMEELNKKGTLMFEFNSPLQDLQSQQDLQNFAQLAQMLQQYFGSGAVMTAINLTNVREFLIKNLRQNHNLFKSPEEIEETVKAMAEQAQQAALPSPSTSAQQLPNFPSQMAGTAV